MAPHIEANSLSDITQLASNPPKYPRNPTEPRRASLTLYVARVPGSKGLSLLMLFQFMILNSLRYHPHYSEATIEERHGCRCSIITVLFSFEY